MQIHDLAEACRAAGCDAEENVRMELYTSFRIGGPADLLVTAHNSKQARQVYSLCRENEIPILILGNGTNMLVGDAGIRGAVLKLDNISKNPEVRDGLLYCPAGVPLKRLCLFARDNGLSGLEFAYGIPGTVGGAVYMNAGAYNGQIADVLSFVKVLYPEGRLSKVPVSRLKMEYRHTSFMEKNAVVFAAGFNLAPGDPSEIGARMEEFLRRRREKQPLEYPSAGSFFKRPEGYYAGKLIEDSGLKGFAVGGAQVSEKHAGFIINRGGATCADVRRLSDIIIDKVKREYGVTLEPEVRFIGE